MLGIKGYFNLTSDIWIILYTGLWPEFNWAATQFVMDTCLNEVPIRWARSDLVIATS